MLYLEYFTFPDSDREFDFFVNQKRTCYDSFYPFQILSGHHLRRIDFEPVTMRQRIGENDGSECDRRKTPACAGQCI